MASATDGPARDQPVPWQKSNPLSDTRVNASDSESTAYEHPLANSDDESSVSISSGGSARSFLLNNNLSSHPSMASMKTWDISNKVERMRRHKNSWANSASGRGERMRRYSQKTVDVKPHPRRSQSAYVSNAPLPATSTTGAAPVASPDQSSKPLPAGMPSGRSVTWSSPARRDRMQRYSRGQHPPQGVFDAEETPRNENAHKSSVPPASSTADAEQRQASASELDSHPSQLDDPTDLSPARRGKMRRYSNVADRVPDADLVPEADLSQETSSSTVHAESSDAVISGYKRRARPKRVNLARKVQVQTPNKTRKQASGDANAKPGTAPERSASDANARPGNISPTERRSFTANRQRRIRMKGLVSESSAENGEKISPLEAKGPVQRRRINQKQRSRRSENRYGRDQSYTSERASSATALSRDVASQEKKSDDELPKSPPAEPSRRKKPGLQYDQSKDNHYSKPPKEETDVSTVTSLTDSETTSTDFAYSDTKIAAPSPDKLDPIPSQSGNESEASVIIAEPPRDNKPELLYRRPSSSEPRKDNKLRRPRQESSSSTDSDVDTEHQKPSSSEPRDSNKVKRLHRSTEIDDTGEETQSTRSTTPDSRERGAEFEKSEFAFRRFKSLGNPKVSPSRSLNKLPDKKKRAASEVFNGFADFTASDIKFMDDSHGTSLQTMSSPNHFPVKTPPTDEQKVNVRSGWRSKNESMSTLYEEPLENDI